MDGGNQQFFGDWKPGYKPGPQSGVYVGVGLWVMMTLFLRTLGRSLHVFQAWFILALLKLDHVGKFGDLVKMQILTQPFWMGPGILHFYPAPEWC